MVRRPKVVNVHEDKCTVPIGEKTKWGNPFYALINKYDFSRYDCLDRYKDLVTTNPLLMADLHELNRQTLGCICHPRDCHGDTLARLVEENLFEPTSLEIYYLEEVIDEPTSPNLLCITAEGDRQRLYYHPKTICQSYNKALEYLQEITERLRAGKPLNLFFWELAVQRPVVQPEPQPEPERDNDPIIIQADYVGGATTTITMTGYTTYTLAY